MNGDELAARLTRLEERVGHLGRRTGGAAQGPRPQSKKLSAKEFLLAKNVTSELQRVLALAYFLEHHEGVTSFNVADLENAFRSAREKLPKNMNDAVNKNIARGFLMGA